MNNKKRKIYGLILSIIATVSMIVPSFSSLASEIEGIALKITASPESQTIEEGSSVTFKTEANDSSCSYEWITSIPITAIEESGWGQVSVAGNSLTINNCKQELDGMKVFCLAQATEKVASSKAELTVNAKAEVPKQELSPVNSFELSCPDGEFKYLKKPSEIYVSGDAANKLTIKPEGTTADGRMTFDIYPNKGFEINKALNAGSIAFNINNFEIESAAVDANGLLRLTIVPKINEEYKAEDRPTVLLFNSLFNMSVNKDYGYFLVTNNETGLEDSSKVVKGSLPAGIKLEKKENRHGVFGIPTEDGVYEAIVNYSTPASGEYKAMFAEAAITIIVESEHLHSYTCSTTDSGNKRFKCACGDSFEIQTGPAEEKHIHKLSGRAIDTSEAGFIKINKTCTECGEMVEVKFAEPDHTDLDGDLHCDYCNKDMPAPIVEEEIEEEVVVEEISSEQVVEEKPAATEKPATNNNKKPAAKKSGSPIPIILLVLVVAGVGGYMFYKKKHKVIHYTPEMMEEERRERESRSPYAAPRPAEIVEAKEPEPEPGSAVLVDSSPVPLEMDDIPKEEIEETKEFSEPIKEEKKPVGHGPLPTPDVIVLQTPKDSQK